MKLQNSKQLDDFVYERLPNYYELDEVKILRNISSTLLRN